MAEIRLSPVEGQVVFPIIYRVSAPSQVVVWDFSHQQYEETTVNSVSWHFYINPAEMVGFLVELL